MENLKSAVSPEEGANRSVAVPPTASTGQAKGEGAEEVAAAPITKEDASPGARGVAALPVEVTVAPIADAMVEADVMPKASTGPRAEDNADVTSLMEQPTERTKKVRILSDKADQPEGSEVVTGNNISDDWPDPAGSITSGSIECSSGTPFYHRLKGERRRLRTCTVIFYQSAYRQVIEHLREDITREHGGLLLGYEGADIGSDELTVYVTKALPAQHTVGSKSRLTFTEDTWAEFANQTEGMVGTNLRRVGWYHSHPNFGIFLSTYDIDVCSNFQRQTQVALVYDPVRNEGGFFTKGARDKGETGYDPECPQGFWECCDLTRDSIVDWTNTEIVSPGGDAESDQDYREALAEAWGSYGGVKMANRNMAGAGPRTHESRIRRLDGNVEHDLRGEAHTIGTARQTRRERLMTLLQGVLLGIALAVLAVAIILNTDVGRGYLSGHSLNGDITELSKNLQRQDEKLEEIKSILARQPGGGGAATAPSQDVSSRENGKTDDQSPKNSAGRSIAANESRTRSSATGGHGGRVPRNRRKTVTRPHDAPSTAQPGATPRNPSAPTGTTETRQPAPTSNRPAGSPAGRATPAPTRPPSGPLPKL
jgi:proteasome lid subunit RPN8/RPN11